MFENFNLSDFVRDTNPITENIRKKKNDAWEKIHDFIDNRLREEKLMHIEECGDAYAEAMRQNKIASVICEDDDFKKLVAEYMEWSI